MSNGVVNKQFDCPVTPIVNFIRMQPYVVFVSCQCALFEVKFVKIKRTKIVRLRKDITVEWYLGWSIAMAFSTVTEHPYRSGEHKNWK
jgi:hypothetical protein